jgi:hypothetical protein
VKRSGDGFNSRWLIGAPLYPVTGQRRFPFERLRRQRIKRPAAILKSGLVSISIRETLAARLRHGNGRTIRIVETEFDPMIVAKVILGKITMQMFFAAVLINTAHAALEIEKCAFC